MHVCGFFLPETPSRKRHPRQNPQRQWSVPNISGKKGGGRSSTFGAYWMGGELKMIREEVTGNPGMIEDLREPAKAIGVETYLTEEFWKA